MLKVYRLSETIIERHIKVRGEANPYDPEDVEYFKKRRCFAWRTYPAGNIRAIAAGKGKKTSQTLSNTTSDCRITSAEDDLRETRAV